MAPDRLLLLSGEREARCEGILYGILRVVEAVPASVMPAVLVVFMVIYETEIVQQPDAGGTVRVDPQLWCEPVCQLRDADAVIIGIGAAMPRYGKQLQITWISRNLGVGSGEPYGIIG